MIAHPDVTGRNKDLRIAGVRFGCSKSEGHAEVAKSACGARRPGTAVGTAQSFRRAQAMLGVGVLVCPRSAIQREPLERKLLQGKAAEMCGVTGAASFSRSLRCVFSRLRTRAALERLVEAKVVLWVVRISLVDLQVACWCRHASMSTVPGVRCGWWRGGEKSADDGGGLWSGPRSALPWVTLPRPTE